MFKRKLAVLAYLIIGFWGLAESWPPASLLRPRQTVAENSVIAFGEYNCVKEAAGTSATMAFLAGAAHDSSDGARFDFVIAQYVMVPTLLRSGYHEEESAIAKYASEERLTPVLEQYDLEVVRACGRGIYLLKRGRAE